jgi:hypothetical protein
LRDLGWSNLATGPILVEEIATDHLRIIRRPAVEHVGRCLDRALG